MIGLPPTIKATRPLPERPTQALSPTGTHWALGGLTMLDRRFALSLAALSFCCLEVRRDRADDQTT